MKKTLLFSLCALCLLALVGCSGGGDDGSANINQDVQSGAPPSGLDGANPASGGGTAPATGGADGAGGGGMATPSSTP
ncbi:MAG TPA: hypothetical protein VK171_08925 [Fimbriimonas sp.]|nr:hypothetical protein [Fimbriimonas sp.]